MKCPIPSTWSSIIRPKGCETAILLLAATRTGNMQIECSSPEIPALFAVQLASPIRVKDTPKRRGAFYHHSLYDELVPVVYCAESRDQGDAALSGRG